MKSAFIRKIDEVTISHNVDIDHQTLDKDLQEHNHFHVHHGILYTDQKFCSRHTEEQHDQYLQIPAKAGFSLNQQWDSLRDQKQFDFL
ncbi:hypothetical protein BDA99DRAFT_517559 [Phascolomyces articulosus]|uniref:Uncharacterized protein n=1 Tax=Phascolomyces articulosus TaxID=60185 RepID=A0AAD5K8L0_9FUNG|nr:hypothetical protein BDA99DRAFT_517559 [Phascolomyces articulosus]